MEITDIIFTCFLFSLSGILFYFAIRGFKHQKEANEGINKRVEQGAEEYIKAFSMLSKKQLDTVGKTLYKITSNPIISVEQIPLEVYMASKAAVTVKGQGMVKNIITDENKKMEIEKLVSSFETMVNSIFGVSGEYTKQAASKGFDFGIITNNAADMTLYSAMNFQEKKRNLSRANMNIKNILQKDVTDLKYGLLKLL